MRFSKWIMGSSLALALVASPRVSRAEDDDTSDQGKPATTSRSTDHADPSTKTLPSHASATAKANAFGQQGAREKAAHQAARNAAANEASNAAQHKADAAAKAATGQAHASSANSHAQRGLATAAAARAGHGQSGAHH